MTPLPPTLTLRRPDRDDAHRLLALASADERHAVGRPTVTMAEVDELLTPAHTRISDDQWVVVDEADSQGAIVGWGLIWDHGNNDHQDIDVYRDPALGGEQVREALLDLLLARLSERARDSGYAHMNVGAGCYAADEPYASTLRSRGFAFSRVFHRLQMPLPADEPLGPISVPRGVQVAPFDFSDDGWRRLHAVVEESFVDHWGYAPISYEDYRADAEAEPSPDREFWRVAIADGDIVGVTKASGRSAENSTGYVAELAVLPSHRGRGIARALLLETFEAYRQAGRRRGELTVDTENTTGALGLYTSVGLRPDIEVHSYTCEVAPAPL